MAFSYPQDTEEFQKERKSYQTLFSNFDMNQWAPNGSDNTDHGMDYGFEYIEDMKYKGYRILSQIKSTESLHKQNNLCIFDLKVATAAYAINCSQPFVLFLVDLVTDITYYICLQDFFINNPDKIQAVENNGSTVRIKIPDDKILTRTNEELKEIAKRQFSFSETNGLMLVR